MSYKKIFFGVLIVIAFMVVLFFIVFPFGIGYWATNSANSEVNEPPMGFVEVELVTEDNVKLDAWYKTPENGRVIMVLHGAGDSREDVRPHIEMLAENKFGVLAFDLRGHGMSDGDTNRFGWDGNKDVGAGVKFLNEQGEVEHIGALGLSMGGEVLLGAVDAYPEIDRVVSEGATYRSASEFRSLPKYQSFQGNFSPVYTKDLAVKIFSGTNPPKPLVESIEESTSARFLFIAAGNEKEEREYNEFFKEKAGDRASVWIIPDCNHIQGIHVAHEEYEKKIVESFAD